ncbi:MAG: efflux RND transporter periplasmic adaptor subunit [Spirochaetaceae bacterium]|jgi:multidrug efflux pump subunit AcrA (membrane-fusion protein)|nr:efflux RND transporter periplasmic adaptor subunit [Spirochaetaceae bacterium]
MNRRNSTGIPWKGTLYIGAFMAIILFSGCEQIKAAQDRIRGVGNNPNTAAAVVPELPVFAVNTTTAVKGLIRDYLALSGDIIAGSTVDTFSEVAGKVTRLYTAAGRRVRKDDPIAEVDPSRPGMTYIPAVVKAPISGTIVTLSAQVGMTVSQAVPLARIAAGSALEIRLYVAERFISRIALRQPCEITLDAWPGEVFRGSITEISPVVDPASRTMEVRVNVENPGSRLKAGMFAKVRIITEQKSNIVKIPAGALIRRFGEDYVFVVETDPGNSKGYIARRKVVKAGILIDGVLEIQEGLAADDEIIVRGQTLLEDGTRINVIERVAPLSVN